MGSFFFFFFSSVWAYVFLCRKRMWRIGHTPETGYTIVSHRQHQFLGHCAPVFHLLMVLLVRCNVECTLYLFRVTTSSRQILLWDLFWWVYSSDHFFFSHFLSLPAISNITFRTWTQQSWKYCCVLFVWCALYWRCRCAFRVCQHCPLCSAVCRICYSQWKNYIGGSYSTNITMVLYYDYLYY